MEMQPTHCALSEWGAVHRPWESSECYNPWWTLEDKIWLAMLYSIVASVEACNLKIECCFVCFCCCSYTILLLCLAFVFANKSRPQQNHLKNIFVSYITFVSKEWVYNQGWINTNMALSKRDNCTNDQLEVPSHNILGFSCIDRKVNK